MRDVYVKMSGIPGSRAFLTKVTTPGYYREDVATVYRILDVPETVSEQMAVLKFNQCSVLGHTVQFSHLAKDQPVRGQGLAWEPHDSSLAGI
jgi:hypothetical protein